MGKEPDSRATPHPERDEAEELRRLLQKDDIASVDEAKFGVQLARNMSNKRAR